MNVAVWLVTGLTLITVHGPDGQRIDINPAKVASVREPRGQGTHFHKEVQCLIGMVDGKFISVVEECDDVRRKIQQSNP